MGTFAIDLLSGNEFLFNGDFGGGGTGSTTITANNGLTKLGDNIALGGTLTGNTTIDVDTNYLDFKDYVFNGSGMTIGSGFNNYVRSIAIQSDGKLILGGNFTSYNGTSANRIIRLN